MTNEQLSRLRAALLKCCIETKTMPEVYECAKDLVAELGERTVERTVKALVVAGDIYGAGETKDRRYKTTKSGKDKIDFGT